MAFIRASLSGLVIVWLAACSGGSGTPAPVAPPVANRAPVFTSAATASLPENSSASFYSATATDADGDPVTFTLVPGGDAAAFTLTASSGALAPATPLDFENPADANRDNAYDLTLEASDGRGGLARLALRVHVTDVAEALRLRRVAAGFSQPLYLEGIPGTDDVVILQKGGRMRVLTPATGVISGIDFLDLTASISADSERGLLGLAFSPQFATDRTFFVNVTNPAGDTEIRRYRMFTGSSVQADPSTGDVILTISQPFANHNAGWIGFANSGLLYIPMGDGGSGGDPGNVAQNPNSLLGKVLRIDVSGDDFPSDPNRDYRIPAGNAFPGGAGGAPEIFALGLRNPFRSSLDPVTGDLLIGDVGQGAIEEINRLRPGDAGANFGWNRREGTQAYNGGANSPSFTPPVAEYSHGSGPLQGRSVTGGYLYRGDVAAIRNQYVFADFITANVWSVPGSALTVGQTVPSSQFTRLNPQLVPDAGSLSQISSFGLDTSGRLYIVSLGGDIFQIEAAP